MRGALVEPRPRAEVRRRDLTDDRAVREGQHVAGARTGRERELAAGLHQRQRLPGVGAEPPVGAHAPNVRVVVVVVVFRCVSRCVGCLQKDDGGERQVLHRLFREPGVQLDGAGAGALFQHRDARTRDALQPRGPVLRLPRRERRRHRVSLRREPPPDDSSRRVLHPLVSVQQQRLRARPDGVRGVEPTGVGCDPVVVVGSRGESWRVGRQSLGASSRRLFDEEQGVIRRLPSANDVVVVVLVVAVLRVVLVQRGRDVGSRRRHRARRFPRRGGDGESERLHRGSSQPRVSRRGGGGRTGRRAPRAPADGEGEELTTRARAGDALEQRRERLARGAPAVCVLVRAQPRDHGDEEKRGLRLDSLRGKSRDDVPEAVHGAQSPGGVLILQVGGERLEVLLKSPLAERIVQQELHQRLRAQLADILGVGSDD
mmetsp:Transcript_10702/g.44460  ORF Transcript_10702/g.44460 Transcript_10702/m.44460 type:complete len:429 (+) Transcript_10702:214-1500(+)